MLCPASATPPAIRIESDDEPARIGSAVHKMLALQIGPDVGGNPDAIAAEFRLDHDAWEEAEILYLTAMKMWRQLEKHFPTPSVEVALASGGLTGHADIASVVEL
jgi:hypothetical protein